MQELQELREKIAAGAIEEAIALVDELEEMSRQARINNIDSFLVVLCLHLIKMQVDKRLTGSWRASIIEATRRIAKLNLMDNKSSPYIKPDEWEEHLEEALAGAIAPASVDISGGKYKPRELKALVDRDWVMDKVQQLLALTYQYEAKNLPDAVDDLLQSWSEAERHS